MKRVFSILSLVLVCSLSAKAQDFPKAEVFGGYSYLRADRVNFNGWNASVAGNLNSWFGLVADFSGHYDSASTRSEFTFPGFPGIPPFPGSSTIVKSEASFHTFLAGPRFSYRKNERITPFAHVLLGASRRHIDSEVDFGVLGRTFFSLNNTAFTAALGGGLDVAISKNIALRVVQADYMLTRNTLARSFGDTRSNGRVSIGLVFRFGNK
ncbi:MAG: outer membrane beta-barrel protein [Acidobacteriota bacterium]